MLMTLDTPHGPNAKFLKNNDRKMREKSVENLDRNLGLHAKNQREISSNKVRRLLWPLGKGKCEKGGGNGIRRGGNGL